MITALRPLVLIRGFGGLDERDEQRNAYQGFNDGTVYPGKRGESYIYEGFLLRALKSEVYPYSDATNVVGYYASDLSTPEDCADWDPGVVSGSIVIDPATARTALRHGVAGTMWVYRYYDLIPRSLARYGEGLTRLIRLIQTAAARHDEEFDGVDVIAHSMGGLVLRAALSQLEQQSPGSAAKLIHRVVTLGTPHRGISFQRIPRWLLERLPAVEQSADEIAAFDPHSIAFRDVGRWFPVERILTVVGTNHRTYGNSAADLLNRLFSLVDEGSADRRRTDGLVTHSGAQLPGAPRTFVHKCHGGPDSLVTSREAFEIAMRFFHATHRARLWLDEALVRGGNRSPGCREYWFGVSIKPRFVDFDLFHQSPEAENCYGPFQRPDLTDDLPDLATELYKSLAEPGDRTTGWAGPDRLIWDGWFDERLRPEAAQGLVFRLDVNVGERDLSGPGFSDNIVFRKQYFAQIFPDSPPAFFLHTGERYLDVRNPVTREQLDELAGTGPTALVQRPQAAPESRASTGTWNLQVGGTDFAATLRLEITAVTN
ncbi:esterase/lipase family protein [Cryptosporangium aurantiacum]|uniref:PGAP1-like protein n=1 Tax=Cryptosporangium aurantiacum TaxID=134849 RepID=A0A1M7R205_9ACTN|nr:alpha/beta hydrolase [Cryptosporangium aurantiacum]SHN38808.1 PGAP1-like protein [Cryptosporangium aurantiacum]